MYIKFKCTKTANAYIQMHENAQNTYNFTKPHNLHYP